MTNTASSRNNFKPLPLPNGVVQTRWPDRFSSDPFQVRATQGWHSVCRGGTWNIAGLRGEFDYCLIHSRVGERGEIDQECDFWSATLIYAPAKSVYVALHNYGDCWFVRVWANSASDAVKLFERLRKTYLVPNPQDDKGEFFVLSQGLNGPDKRRVKIQERRLDEAELSLNYGDDFAEWHRDLLKLMTERPTGLTILQGPPGTGKTSYLRYLLYETRKTHRFYYLPISAYPMLIAPTSVDFWIAENEASRSLSRVVVVEDAESLLVKRDMGNQESVSNLLNMADGFLGDFLKLHVVCTINAPVDKLDPAIARPGRLIAGRRFGRLTATDANRLATAKGLKLEPREDYSLAEIYNNSAALPDEFNNRTLGFSPP